MLHKRAQQRRRTTLRANIKQRWFQLTCDTLAYFQCDGAGSRRLRGAIPTASIRAVEPLPAPAWMFEVVHDGAVLYCQASSQAEQQHWIQAIRAALPSRSIQAPSSEPVAAAPEAAKSPGKSIRRRKLFGARDESADVAEG